MYLYIILYETHDPMRFRPGNIIARYLTVLRNTINYTV